MDLIPTPYGFFLLALAAFRLTRLISYDTFPPIVRARIRLLGITDEHCSRPLLYELFACAYCLGAWVSLAVYAAWLTVPTVTVYAAVPLALSAAVGLVASNLDA